MVYGVPDAPCLEMGVSQQICHCVYGSRQQSAGLRCLDRFAFGQRRQPIRVRTFNGIDKVLWLGAHGRVDLRVIEQILSADQTQQAR